MTRIFAQSSMLVKRVTASADVLSITAMQSTIADTVGSSVGYVNSAASLLSDGTWQQSSSGENAYGYSGFWITPATNMALYSARWTNTSGTLSSGTAGSWLALSTSRVWYVERSGINGTKSCTGTLDIALTSNTSVILATKSITLSAQIYNDGGGGFQ